MDFSYIVTFSSFMWNFLTLKFKLLYQWMELASEPNKEAVIKALLSAKEAMLRIRNHMRLMGEAAGVPVSSFNH